MAVDPGPASTDRPIVESAGPNARHEAVYADICARIRSGEYRPDTRLPGERELSLTYGVSRVTVRQAIAKAERHGLLTKAPGRGTFVARPLVLQDLAEVRTFRNSIHDVAMRPSYELRGKRWAAAAGELTRALDVAAGTPVLHVELLGLANGRPLAAYRAALAPLVAAQVDAALETSSDRSTFELAAEALGVRHLDVEQTFEAVSIEPEAARLLQVPVGSSAFRTSSLYHTSDGRRIEWREAIYPGERYSFRAHRTIEL